MAITWQFEQGSAEWHRKRLGMPTASMFHKIITTKGAFSEQRHDYRNELLAERLLGRATERYKTPWMERGTALEGDAVQHFLSHQRDVFGRTMALEKVGFITTDDGRVGCSPDRLISRDTGGNAPREAVEIKCPAPWTQIGYLLDGLDDAYTAQVQGQMYVGEFDVVHFYSYHPELPAFYRMTERRTGYIDKLHTYLDQFLAELDTGEALLRRLMAEDAKKASLEGVI